MQLGHQKQEKSPVNFERTHVLAPGEQAPMFTVTCPRICLPKVPKKLKKTETQRQQITQSSQKQGGILLGFELETDQLREPATSSNQEKNPQKAL